MIFGVDVSRWQGAIDHRRIRAEGHEFLIAKISQGTGTRDPQWPRNRDGARAAGLITAGYHYIDTSDADAQARNCAGWLGDRNIPIALDHERGGGNFANFRAVLDAFRRAGLKVVLSYIPPFYWREIGSPNLAGIPPLWKARYASTNPGTPSGLYARVPANYWDAYGGMAPVLLQFSDAALVAGQRMDCNAYRGTRDQFAALIGGGSVVAPAVTGGFLVGLSDAEQGECLAMIRTMHMQLAQGDGPKDHWGWQTFAGGTNERMTMVDYARRANVRTEDLFRAMAGRLDTINGKLDQILAAVRAAGVDPVEVRAAITAALGGGLAISGSAVPMAPSRATPLLDEPDDEEDPSS